LPDSIVTETASHRRRGERARLDLFDDETRAIAGRAL
jgi:hypothetical protein